MRIASLIIVAAAAADDQCCKHCDESASLAKYYSVDKLHNKCGECCMKPSQYKLYKVFEPGLTAANGSDTPCRERGFSNYDSTVTHGFGPVKMTLDLYDPAPSTATASFECPKWLGPICTSGCIAAHCAGPLSECIVDTECRARLQGMGKCMQGSNQTTDALYPYDCLVPNNDKVNAFLNCAMEKHPCVNASSTPTPVYPVCRDHEIAGDAAFRVGDLAGQWHKVHSWRLGEPIECQPCQNVTLELEPEYTPEQVQFFSHWVMPDYTGHLFNMSAVSTMAARGGGQPDSKLYNQGLMSGLSFHEPYTVVASQTKEQGEPFVFFYVCGGTLQGNYTTAFVLARKPAVGAATQAQLAAVAKRIGLSWSDFCTVDNSCFSN